MLPDVFLSVLKLYYFMITQYLASRMESCNSKAFNCALEIGKTANTPYIYVEGQIKRKGIYSTLISS